MKMDKRNINVPIDFVKNMIRSLFTKEANKQKHIVDALISMLPDYQLEMFLELIHRERYEPLSIGDHIRFKPSTYYLDNYDKDILNDVGLYRNGYLSGYIISDDSYGNSFNPYSHKMKINVYLYKDGDLHNAGDSLNTLDLEMISKLDIPYFKLTHDETITL